MHTALWIGTKDLPERLHNVVLAPSLHAMKVVAHAVCQRAPPILMN
jgi:hypothetical protein